MRYLGGKFKIRKALGTFINERLEGRDYYEPFVGAAWVLGEVTAKNRYASDYNPWLITMWQEFVAYKTQAKGITVNYVNPAYSSQSCSVCHELGKRVKHRFACPQCGHVAHSDINGARNIAAFAEVLTPARGAVNRPNVHSGAPV